MRYVSVSDDLRHYCALIAITYPKDEWSKYWGLDNAERLDELNKITSSTELANSQLFVRKKWAGPSDAAMIKLRADYEHQTTPLRVANLNEENGVWRIESGSAKNKSIHMKRGSGLCKVRSGYRNVKPISINYKGHLVTQKDMFEEVYDPEYKKYYPI